MTTQEKKSKIIQSVLSNEWQNPGGTTTYYYDVVFENGDLGSVGVNQKSSSKVEKGAEVTYTIMGGKIKVLQVTETAQTVNQPAAYAKKNSNSQASFLGYAWSYAKDFVIAGKTMKDVAELNEVARYIYDEIGKMLNNEK